MVPEQLEIISINERRRRNVDGRGEEERKSLEEKCIVGRMTGDVLDAHRAQKAQLVF